MQRRGPRLRVRHMSLWHRLCRLRTAPLASVAAIAAAAVTRAPGVPGRRHYLFGHMRLLRLQLRLHLRLERHLRGRWAGLLRCPFQSRYGLHGLRPAQHVQAASSASVPAAPAAEAASSAGRPLGLRRALLRGLGPAALPVDEPHELPGHRHLRVGRRGQPPVQRAVRHPDDRTVDHHGCVLRCRA